ncbi:hypothetical protein ACGVWS_12070 [Enterobacteriaceae bacterium LUAb1]
MKQSDLPAKKPVPFGENGPRREITSTTPTGSNQASYDSGFPPVTMIIKSAGGLPPEGRDINQAFYELYNGLRSQNAGSVYSFDSDFAAAIGGYPAGSMLQNSTNDGFWLNTTDDNSNNPESSSGELTGWVPTDNYGFTVLTGLTSGVITLSSLQAAKNEIQLNGALIANVTVIFPRWTKQWEVINQTTGGFTVTCKTTIGSGIVIQPSILTKIYCNGTDINTYPISDMQGIVKSVNSKKPNGSGNVLLNHTDVQALGSTETAVAAIKLATARTIGGTAFDGTANITPALSTAATRLQTARTIAGVSFDGTANIAIPAGNVGAYTKAEVDTKVNTKAEMNTASKAANGWWKCSSTGIIFQWGAATISANPGAVTFPVAFPTVCFRVLATDVGNGHISYGASPLSNAQARIYTGNIGTVACFFAIGY